MNDRIKFIYQSFMCRLRIQNSVPDLYMCEIFAKKYNFSTYFKQYGLIDTSKCLIFVLVSMNDRNKTSHLFFILVWYMCHSNFLTEICEILECNLVSRINWHSVIGNLLRQTSNCSRFINDGNKLIPILYFSYWNTLTLPLIHLYVWNIFRILFGA